MLDEFECFILFTIHSFKDKLFGINLDELKHDRHVLRNLIWEPHDTKYVVKKLKVDLLNKNIMFV